ncbi:MAG: hypothetical protein V2A54_10165 [Bacteroidota bacterium]
MKKILKSLTVLVIAAVAFASCGSSSSPKATAEKFLNHIQKKEYAEAKKLATKESEATIDMMASFGSMGGEQKEAKIEMKDEKIDGDKATVNYVENGENKTLSLVKVDGDWKVDMKKETPPVNDTPADTTASADTTKK